MTNDKELKEKIIATVKDYLNDAKETDCGKYGKAFEIGAKMYLNGNKGNSKHVSARGKHDVQYHGLTIEIKSNCGEINDNIETNRFVAYSMDNRISAYYPWHCHVMTVEEFKETFETLGLVRTKKTSAGYITKAIQSYKNSKRKAAALTQALAQFPTLADWKAVH